MEAHPYARRLTTDEYRLVEDLTRKKGYVHDYDTHPVTNELEALFLVHPSSFKIWRAFPHVLIIDATYKTNIYKMPFVEIVGITSTSKIFCIAFAFISEEKKKNYKWVLERLKLTLEGCMLPRVIITNRELALIGEYIPLDSVDIFWRTLNISWSELVEDGDIQCKDVLHRFKEKFSIQNVGSDGNYGFRAVALGLGLLEDQWHRIRSDLVRELEARQRQYKYVFGTIGYEKTYNTVKFAKGWMEMLDTGLVIASAYKKVVVNLSDAGGCNTSFSLSSKPSQSDSHETIVVAYVDGNHYIRVALREGFPLPLTHPLWITYRSDIASGWKHKFVSHQNEFREYYYRTPESYDLT
uniref:OTU domain-containing protein n=1 Tax=Tanacetum cinerariifolium TaxID=118510 RepID=A0A6L2JZ19_TANCI|nr:hypothetical protein [Tanacetum cinerariifolium]